MQAEEACPASKFILHGRQMPGLPQNHHCFQSRANGRPMQGLFNNPMHTNRR